MTDSKFYGVMYEFFTDGATLTGTESSRLSMHYDFTPDWEPASDTASTHHSAEYSREW